jgi:hypothetical protein
MKTTIPLFQNPSEICFKPKAAENPTGGKKRSKGLPRWVTTRLKRISVVSPSCSKRLFQPPNPRPDPQHIQYLALLATTLRNRTNLLTQNNTHIANHSRYQHAVADLASAEWIEPLPEGSLTWPRWRMAKDVLAGQKCYTGALQRGRSLYHVCSTTLLTAYASISGHPSAGPVCRFHPWPVIALPSVPSMYWKGTT